MSKTQLERQRALRSAARDLRLRAEDIRTGQIDAASSRRWGTSATASGSRSPRSSAATALPPPATSATTPPATRWTSPRSTGSRSSATRARARSPRARSAAAQLQEHNGADQIISLMDMGGPTFTMGDHADHIHVGYHPQFGATGEKGKQFEPCSSPTSGSKLIGGSRKIEKPKVPQQPLEVLRSRRGAKGKHARSEAHAAASTSRRPACFRSPSSTSRAARARRRSLPRCAPRGRRARC